MHTIVECRGRSLVVAMRLRSKLIRPIIWVASCIVAFKGSQPVFSAGGWYQNVIPVQTGWNHIWLPIDVPNEPGVALSGVDYESIWSFTPGRSEGDAGRWVSHHRTHPVFLNSLKRLQGNRGYLIKMNSAGNLSLTGAPINRSVSYIAQSFNSFGTLLDQSNAPSFSEYFSHPNVQGKVQSIYQLSAGGGWTSVALNAAITQHRAYWVKVSQDIAYPGPIQLKAGLEGFQFMTTGYADKVRVELPFATIPRSLSIQGLPSASPPAGQPVDAAPNDASWLEYLNTTNPNSAVWMPLTGGTQMTIAGNSTENSVQIRCVRKNRNPAVADGTGSSAYQGLVQITDTNGVRLLVGSAMEKHDYYGVWIGEATLNQVKTRTTAQPAQLAPAKPLRVPLIISLPTPAEGGSNQILDKTMIEVDRDGRKLNYRFVSVLFHQPMTLSGTTNGVSGTLTTGPVTMAADHPLNPYRHRYNPEHRNGYAITREIWLDFAATDQDPMAAAVGLSETEGDNQLVGIYRERIHGVSLEDIHVQGTFRLYRISDTAQIQPPP